MHAFHEYTNQLSLFEIPSLQGSFYELQLLRILKSKSGVFAKIAETKSLQDSSKFYLLAALDHIKCAMRLIAKIRGGYMTGEAKLFITEHEKECYISAMHYCTRLWQMTGDRKYVNQAYDFSRQSKAALLQHDIICNNTLFSGNIPDSLTDGRNSLKQRVKTLRRLVAEEEAERQPNQDRISVWRDNVFSCVKEIQDIEQQIKTSYPGYENLLQKTYTAPLEQVQACLQDDETMVEYAIGKGLGDVSTSLFTFIISEHDLDMIHTSVDSLFFEDIRTIENAFSSLGNSQPGLEKYHRITASLHQLYLTLIQPVEDRLNNNNLLIVPDGDLAKIPFDALLTSPEESKKRINFAALQYLLYKYEISYAYSASLLCRNRDNEVKPNHIYAFAPSYGADSEDQTRAGLGNLEAIFQEIEGIGKWFSQCQFISGQQASKRSFRSVSSDNAILHLAMHASVNKDNHNYSYLAFSDQHRFSCHINTLNRTPYFFL